MQSLTYQQSTGFTPAAMINRAQQTQDVSGEALRDAVRAWSAVAGQDVVTAHIVEEWRQRGGEGIDFPADHSRARQKLFRFLDNRFESELYRENIRRLTPAILAVLPLEYRGKLMPEDSFMSRYAELEKEISEAKRAVMLNAPTHQLVKEIREAAEKLLSFVPADSLGAVLSSLAAMAPGVM